MNQRELSSGGRVRTYLLYVPASYEPSQPTPLVIMLHGGGGNAASTVGYTRFTAEADRDGWLLVYPDGTGPDRQFNWNDGRPGIYPAENHIDDTRFMADLIDAISAQLTIDPRRIYATGISNGGMMSYRLGCELSDRLAAIAPVAATLTLSPCTPTNPISVLHIHGTADHYVPIGGGVGITRSPGFQLASVSKTIAFWRDFNRCSGPTANTKDKAVTKETATGCVPGTDVVLYTIDGAGHGWPGRAVSFAPGENPSTALDATSTIWQFFKDHTRPNPAR